MARVYKRGRAWCVDYSDGGKRIRQTVGPDKHEAEAYLAKIVTEQRHARLFGDHTKEITFRDLHPKAMAETTGRIREVTRVRYELAYKFLEPTFGDLFIAQITPHLIQDYIATRLAGGVMGSTVNRELGVLRRALALAVRWDWLDDNPFKRVRLPREPQGRLRYLEPHELRILLDFCPGWLKSIVVLAVNTGMRRGEILDLTWDRVDLAANLIYLEETKNGQRRSVPVNQTAADILHSLPRRLDSPLVFYRPENGQKLGNISITFRKAVDRAGIQNFKFHDLRHTCASWLVMAGVELNTVREILGHKSMAMTIRYAHLAPKKAIEGSRKLDEVFALVDQKRLFETG